MLLDWYDFRRICFICLFALVLASFVCQAAAAPGNTELSLSVKETVLQNQSPTQDDSGQITNVSPGLRFTSQRRNHAVDINYNLNAIFYHGLSESDRETHNLGLSSQITHQPGQWSSRITGGISQANLDPNGLQIVDPLLTSSNTQELRTLNLTTSYQGKLASVASYNLDLGANLADFRQAQSTEGVNAGFSIAALRSVAGLDWSVSIKTQQLSTGSQERNIDDAALRFGYPYDARWRLFADLTLTRTDAPKDESESALVGVDYRFSRQTGIRLGAGERDGGESYSLDIDHRSRQISFTARYQEEIITPRDQSLRTLDDSEKVRTSFQDLSIVPVLQQRTDVGLVIDGRRSQITVKLFNSRQKDRSIPGSSQTFRGGALGFRRTLSRHSDVSATFLTQTTDQTVSNRLMDLNLVFSRALTKDLNFETGLRSVKQESDLATSRYEQRSIFASVRKKF